jgi:DNA-binding NtrC family response regulator
VRAVALSILKRQGYEVLMAATAEDARALCRQENVEIDLLLTDVVMPQMSGPELAIELSASRPRMRVLFMSGYTEDSIVRHGVLAGEMAFVQKPITSTSLGKKVREVLDSPSLERVP